MPLRPEYALANSPYNAFLFAAVGEEKAGQHLTVLSALARLGFDPWKEAARLAALPREAAARVFAVTIAMLPEGDWKVSDSGAIATRLVASLPKSGESLPPASGATAQQSAGGRAVKGTKPSPMPWLFWAAIALAALLLALAA